MNQCSLIKEIRCTMVYVHVMHNDEFLQKTKVFVDTYHKFPPGIDHISLVVVNGKPDKETLALFEPLQRVRVLEHDNTGWDIGAFIAASKIISTPAAIYFGNTSFVQRAGWLARMMGAWDKYGPGMYGSFGTYEVCPHMNTSGFLCDPRFLSQYPHPVFDKPGRYNFEWGHDAMWKRIAREGLPVKMVTWDGEYDWMNWRKPPNIFRRGDQSNCVTFFRHSLSYGLADAAGKRHMASLADTLTDPDFNIAVKSNYSEGSLVRANILPKSRGPGFGENKK
jgi:hypothetical protein